MIQIANSMKLSLKTQRNNGLDLLKTICAFLIVCIHSKFPEPVNTFFLPICRVAVPVFFMITGYFYRFDKPMDKKRQIKRILSLTIMANLFYILWNLLISTINGESIISSFKSMFTLNKMILLVITNDNSISGHLWYLSALLYVLIIFLLFPKLNMLGKYRYLIIALLLCFDLAFGKYSILLFKHEFPVWITRNFIFVGVPYFWIGIIIHEKKMMLKEKKWKIFLCCIVFSCTSVVESILLKYYNLNASRDNYLSTLLLAISLFMFALCVNRYTILSRIGKNHSQNIYIFHPAIISLLTILLNNKTIINIYEYISPIVVYILTLLVSMIFAFIKGVRQQGGLNNENNKL